MPTARDMILLLGGRRRPRYGEKVLAIERANLLAYWPLTETSGTTINDASGSGRNGTATGFSWADAAGPGVSMGSAPLLDGTNDYGNIHTASLAAAINGAEGGLFVWVKLANPADASNRVFANLFVDASNRIVLDQSAANTMRGRYIAGGTITTVTTTVSNTAWFLLGLTWSKSAEQVKLYLNGAQTGATQTALGTWVGTPFIAVLGASTTTPTLVHNGHLAHAVLWSKVLTPAQIAALAVPS